MIKKQNLQEKKDEFWTVEATFSENMNTSEKKTKLKAPTLPITMRYNRIDKIEGK